MASGRFVPVCKNCGKRGNIISGTFQGTMPTSTPQISGKCPAHPSGKPNMPHSPSWEKV